MLRSNRAPPASEDDEITVERRVRLPREAVPPPDHPTVRLLRIDSALLALSRHDVPTSALEDEARAVAAAAEEPDPFGGLIPIWDDETPADVEEDIDAIFEQLLVADDAEDQ